MITKNLKPAIFRERIRDCGASSEVELVTTLDNDNQRGQRPMVGLITTPTIYQMMTLPGLCQKHLICYLLSLQKSLYGGCLQRQTAGVHTTGTTCCMTLDKFLHFICKMGIILVSAAQVFGKPSARQTIKWSMLAIPAITRKDVFIPFLQKNKLGFVNIKKGKCKPKHICLHFPPFLIKSTADGRYCSVR